MNEILNPMQTAEPTRSPLPPHGLHRIEHYALYILNGMAAGGSGCLSDADIDLAIDAAERLAQKLRERGHIHPAG